MTIQSLVTPEELLILTAAGGATSAAGKARKALRLSLCARGIGWCPECQQAKPQGHMGAPSTRLGYSPKCHACEAVRLRAWRQVNVARVRTKARAWNDRNRDTRRAADRARRRSDPAKVLWTLARTRAAKQGVPFTLSVQWVREQLSRGTCAVTGLALCIGGFDGIVPTTPSLDKLVPEVGYTPENTLLVCWGLNTLKQQDTDFGNACDFIRMASEALNRALPEVIVEET